MYCLDLVHKLTIDLLRLLNPSHTQVYKPKDDGITFFESSAATSEKQLKDEGCQVHVFSKNAFETTNFQIEVCLLPSLLINSITMGFVSKIAVIWRRKRIYRLGSTSMKFPAVQFYFMTPSYLFKRYSRALSMALKFYTSVDILKTGDYFTTASIPSCSWHWSAKILS